MTLQFLTILAAAGGMGALALTHNAPAEYFMFSALLALLLVSYAASRVSTRALSIERSASDRVYADEPLHVRIQLSNQGRFPRFLLDVNDPVPGFMEAEGDHEFMVPTLWPGEQVSLTYRVRARKRGVYRWDALRVSASDPFGVFQRFVPIEAQGEAVVYPRPLEIGGALGQTGVEFRGISAGERARGAESGLDFYGIRDYTPGDDLRRIHWPATAHHGKLTVVEFDRGASENMSVVLDTAAGTDFGGGLDSSLEVGVLAAASLVHWALRSEGLGCLAVSQTEGPYFVSAHQPQQEYEVLEVLARVQSEGNLPCSELLRWTAPRLGPDANVVVITSSPDPGLAGVVGSLQRRDLKVTVLLLDPHSFDPKAFGSQQGAQGIEETGARVLTLRRGVDLQEVLGRVIAGRQ